jgi:hypothetical protein
MITGMGPDCEVDCRWRTVPGVALRAAVTRGDSPPTNAANPDLARKAGSEMSLCVEAGYPAAAQGTPSRTRSW